MQYPGIGVRFPLLSSVFSRLKQSAPLVLTLVCASGPAPAADTQTERMIGPGVKCITLTRDQGPQVIRVIQADGESGYIRPGLTFASDRGLRAAPVSTQAAQATLATRYPIAGVNGDFFARSGGPFEADPIGALVIGGEVISSPYPRPAFLIGADGTYTIRRLRLAAWVERADGARRDLSGLNQPRLADNLVLYTPRFGHSTTTNVQGTEATLTGIELPLRLGQTYRARVAGVGDRGNSPIPTDAVVLSGHGAARDFIRALKLDEEIQFRLEFDPPVPPDTDVIGGGPTLLRAGQVVVGAESAGFKTDVINGRAPRTAVGYHGRRLFLVTVDGRRPGVSIGMTLQELAELMQELGCTDALNLDGGGSTTTWVRGAVVNAPSDGRERRVANALFVFSTAPIGPPVRLIVSPEEIPILAGASLPLTLTGAEDEFYNPVPLPPNPPIWRVDPALGEIVTQQGVQLLRGKATAVPSQATGTGQAEPTLNRERPPTHAVGGPGPQPLVRVGLLLVEAGNAQGAARLRVYARPPRLEVTPPAAVLMPESTQSFAVRALDETGRPLITEGLTVSWSCPPELGQIDATGLLRASSTPARGELTVELAGTHIAVPVTIGEGSQPLDGFEVPRWTGVTFPATVKGAVSLVETGAREGRRCLRIEYDFGAERSTRAVYAMGNLSLGQPNALRVWVRGDGGGAWLRARLRDPNGRAEVVDFSRNLSCLNSWQELKASLPTSPAGPWTLEALYLVEPDPQAQPKGAIYLDALSADYAPVPSSSKALPAVKTLPPPAPAAR